MNPILLRRLEIQDAAVKSLTLAECTNERPCDVDQAPVCKAIRHGSFQVNGVEYKWISTYSYRGWCSLIAVKPVPCDQKAKAIPGFVLCDLRCRSMHGNQASLRSEQALELSVPGRQ